LGEFIFLECYYYFIYVVIGVVVVFRSPLPGAMLLAAVSIVLVVVACSVVAVAEDVNDKCVECHREVSPGLVEQYFAGAMGAPGVQNPRVSSMLGGMDRVPCTTCHGAQHTSSEDWMEAELPDYETCRGCHPVEVEQFLAGKHALAWRAMMAIPMTKKMPPEEVLFGCGGCHKIGVKSREELLGLGLSRPYGIGATCDQCHTRHRFSVVEARQPEACAKCHMGFDHPQWEMWKTSKHGNIYFANKDRYPLEKSLKEVEPWEYPGPTCQLCHMPKGNHSVLAPWGFIGLVAFQGRPSGLEVVEDPEWEEAKASLLKALRVLDPEGNPTPLLKAVVDLRIVRVDPKEFMDARKRLLEVCSGCHSEQFALSYLKAADEVVRWSTIELAKAIELIADARRRGWAPPRQEEPGNPYPFLLNFYEEPSGIDREAYLIFMEYRMRAFQGMFHVNPDYTHWYGWSQIRRAIGDIKDAIELLAFKYSASKSLEELSKKVGELGEERKATVTTVTEVRETTTVVREVTTTIEKPYTTTIATTTTIIKPAWTTSIAAIVVAVLAAIAAARLVARR
jgi:hypothetical protein